MYNALFGVHPEAHILLSWLELKEDDFYRFRDCYFSKDGKRIIVFTRCGGPNRKDYETMYTVMKNNPLYIRDYDDDYDNTYSSIEFIIPSKYQTMAESMFKKADTLTGAEKFQNLFTLMENNPDEAFKDPRVKKVTENLEQAFANPTGQINTILVNPDGTVEQRG